MNVDNLRELYEGHSAKARGFRDFLFVFDITAILYVIVSSFLPENETMQWINRLFGVVVLADLAARIFISRRPTRELIRPLTVAEIVAAISFLWPLGGGAFLRALRTLRLLRSYALSNGCGARAPGSDAMRKPWSRAPTSLSSSRNDRSCV